MNQLPVFTFVHFVFAAASVMSQQLYCHLHWCQQFRNNVHINAGLGDGKKSKEEVKQLQGIFFWGGGLNFLEKVSYFHAAASALIWEYLRFHTANSLCLHLQMFFF